MGVIESSKTCPPYIFANHQPARATVTGFLVARPRSETSMSTAPAAPKILAKGLVGVIAAQTALSSVAGQSGVLTCGGINIHELAGQALYEEVVPLLFYGHLPARAELDSF